MKSIITTLYLSLFLHILILLVAGQSPPIYSPVDNITLACGYSGPSTNSDSRTWRGDINLKLSPIEEAGRGNNTSQSREVSPGTSSASQVPYTTARLSYSQFTYKIPLSSPGQKFIRLHFNPATYTPDFDRSNSLFSVKAGGFTLLSDFNATVTAYVSPPQIREFCVNVETEQSLNITFTPAKDAYAFINGIEIVSMPTGLYYIRSPKFIGSETLYPIENNTAMEMVYRINIGGSPISPNGDTGMYRNWDAADEKYLDDVSREFSVLPQNNTIEPNFVTIPKYSAPKAVYVTGRSMGMNKTINKSYNLTWVFPLDPRFYYLVRLHFCEFEGDIINFGDRSFQIYMANQTAEELADVIGWSKGNGNPVYRDYVVGMFMSPAGGRKKVDLFLVLAALQKDSYTSYNDAILNGLEIFKLSDSNRNLAQHTTNPPDTENKKTPMVAIVTGVVSGLLVLSVLGFLVFRRQWKLKDSGSGQRTTKSTMNPMQFLPTNLCRYFSLAEIKAATKNFNDTFTIGAGGFGNVYKGCIDGGATPVAIKRLKQESSQGAQEFKTEIEMLSQFRHRHLVTLIGYCADKGEMILVYDYMARGTLRDHLYYTNKPPLSWEQRLQICIGTARGLQYLHSGAKGTIIHRDVKSTNILLDDKWVAKVSDFGLSKETNNMSTTHISTVVKGSFGYLDPEYYRRQRLTEKSDVYSLGVVLFEVLCARPAVIQTEELKQVSLAEWAKTCHQNEELDQIIDPSLRGKIAAECLSKFTEVGISCIHENGTERPSMNDVVKGLELALELQQRAEGNINCAARNAETETSSSEQSCVTIDSIKCISATIFSEINFSSGR
ncbi:hypothetical protein M0R45_033252 [Rubus argutus]|uniref:Protein kinase domain-containing protein n=1 Tax=Rubus argutus TaxID=59490 RepID=A0AAW1WMD5_RUBAR